MRWCLKLCLKFDVALVSIAYVIYKMLKIKTKLPFKIMMMWTHTHTHIRSFKFLTKFSSEWVATFNENDCTYMIMIGVGTSKWAGWNCLCCHDAKYGILYGERFESRKLCLSVGTWARNDKITKFEMHTNLFWQRIRKNACMRFIVHTHTHRKTDDVPRKNVQ